MSLCVIKQPRKSVTGYCSGEQFGERRPSYRGISNDGYFLGPKKFI